MRPRTAELLEEARRRNGGFWTRRIWWNAALDATEKRPVPVRIARALESVLDNMPVEIRPGERIVGLHPETWPAEGETPPPWRSLMPDQTPYRLPEEIAALHAGVISSGNKTGHLTADYPTLCALGVDGLLRRIERDRVAPSPGERAERHAMAIALHAFSRFSERHAEAARSLARNETDPDLRSEYLAVAEACGRIAHGPAGNLREALQLVWFAFLVQCIEEGESTAAFALGRFDQYIGPYWEIDRRAGADRDDMADLVAGFWVKLNEFSGLQVLNMTIGGAALPAPHADGANELSSVCLELSDAFRTSTPSLSVRWNPATSPDFLEQALRVAVAGFGQPAFYGDPGIVQALRRSGVGFGDALDTVPGGCVELGIQGCSYPWVGNFFNIPKCLELALHDGVDPASGKRLGPATGTANDFENFEAVVRAFETQVDYFIGLMQRSDNTTDRLAGEYNPFPFLSTIVADCIERGRDITAGGARYNFTEIQGIGVPHVVDSLLNIRRLVFEKNEVSLPDLVNLLDRNFEGDEPLRLRLQRMRPAYGDDTPESAAMARRVTHHFFTVVERGRNPRGGAFRPGLLVWTLYHEWADAVGALPDGRRRGDALASSIGPRGEVEIGGPTTVIHDATAFDHTRCTGGLTLNLRFSAAAVRDRDGINALGRLLETYFRRGGLQVQINVIDSALLREARENPDAHADLCVRVSGFSTRFVTLSTRMQDEIIAREEMHTG